MAIPNFYMQNFFNKKNKNKNGMIFWGVSITYIWANFLMDGCHFGCIIKFVEKIL
jgi:hypothetical protein